MQADGARDGPGVVMYALHPGSLPPKSATGKTRIDVTAEDLARLYKLEDWQYIVWDKSDPMNAGLLWFDFIHLYPSYYGRYTLVKGQPQKDWPNGKLPALRERRETSGGSTRFAVKPSRL